MKRGLTPIRAQTGGIHPTVGGRRGDRTESSQQPFAGARLSTNPNAGPKVKQ